ncbi:hypothetical protein OEZ85_004868 [Tetradesmus obliquus]|uniref:Peptidase S8/S53 domain-containing protein n=1 Tax=Tetradesmus obliquus TaxID=3088 RepID=A0ABY8UJV4_TETOB|nr:hypothetical protein OEZ85_004868 [Tetradesmus obliquus]
MNRIAMQSIWQQPGLIPFSGGFTKRGTIIDTGVDYNHLDMLGMNSQLQIDKSRSATFNRAGNSPAQGASNLNLVSTSVTGHGTHVAGIMAGGWGNGDSRGIAGVLGPTSSGLVMCNAFSPGSYFSSSMVQVAASTQDLLACYNHTRSVDAHWVINMSLGGPGTMAEMAAERDTIKQTICNNGGMVVVAAGNEGLNISAAGTDASGYQYDGQYPAKFAALYPDCVLTVAAVDNSDRLATFSNWGSAVGVAAPGVGIFSDIPSRYADSTISNYWASATWSGTSMATPYVAAVALLIRNAVPSATAAQVIRCIKATSLAQPVKPAVGDTSGVKRISGGILNAAAALDCVKTAVAALAAPAAPPALSGPPSASPKPAMQPNPTPSPSPSPKPSPSPSPSPDPSPSPSPNPASAGVPCPSTGLPLCVSALTGTLPAAGSRSCPNGKYTLAVRNSSGNRATRFRMSSFVCLSAALEASSWAGIARRQACGSSSSSSSRGLLGSQQQGLLA